MQRLGPVISGCQVVGAVSRLSGMTQRELDLEPRRASPQERTDGIQIRGGKTTDANRDLLSSSSGDAIVGFITKTAVSVFTEMIVERVVSMDEQPERIIEVSWVRNRSKPIL